MIARRQSASARVVVPAHADETYAIRAQIMRDGQQVARASAEAASASQQMSMKSIARYLKQHQFECLIIETKQCTVLFQ